MQVAASMHHLRSRGNRLQTRTTPMLLLLLLSLLLGKGLIELKKGHRGLEKSKVTEKGEDDLGD